MQKEKLKKDVKKIPASIALLTAELIFVFSVFIVSLTSVIIIIRSVFYNQEVIIDQKVFDFIVPYISKNKYRDYFVYYFFGILLLYSSCLVNDFLLLSVYKKGSMGVYKNTNYSGW